MLPAYEFCMKASHAFNCLDARGAISVTERERFIGRVRGMAKACAETYVASRARSSSRCAPAALRAQAVEAYQAAPRRRVNAAALAAARAVDRTPRRSPMPADPRVAASDLLSIEIGEEIPAKMLARQLVELPALVEKRLADCRHNIRGRPQKTEDLAARD